MRKYYSIKFPLQSKSLYTYTYRCFKASDWKKIFANIRETNLSISSVIPKAKHDATDEEI